MKQKNVAVIGAGIAGLSCAQMLSSHGWGVCVFEKSRGVGGRMSTRQGETWFADHGAQYFTVESQEFFGQTSDWLRSGAVAEWNGEWVTIDGKTLSRTHASRKRYVGVPGMTAPAKEMSRHLDVRLCNTVNSLIRVAQGWRIGTLEHGEYDTVFDVVVMATPSPQAAVLLEPVCADIAAAAGAVEMIPCWAGMLVFERACSLPFDAAVVRASPLAWMARNASKPGRSEKDVWVLHASGEWSAQHIEASPSDVARVMLDTFAEISGRRPDAFSMHRWRYANCRPSDMGFIWREDVGIGLCGDWTTCGKVEGAWSSGRSLASAILS